ncbi:hypothetical protein DPEC_G00161140 [Dallia pectoralis]|uniref:Uncharacterized protein n=1 Tax=Dallia pectoralis TaxID=75939 RepID=A0ACC2GFX7_DALPE|nr:hypothetical protein DPEC_G00161140 [Dallia pectoralis]
MGTTCAEGVLFRCSWTSGPVGLIPGQGQYGHLAKSPSCERLSESYRKSFCLHRYEALKATVMLYDPLLWSFTGSAAMLRRPGYKPHDDLPLGAGCVGVGNWGVRAVPNPVDFGTSVPEPPARINPAHDEASAGLATAY